MLAVGNSVMVTLVEQVEVFPESSETDQLIVDSPILNKPLASGPVPSRMVVPMIVNVMVSEAVQLSEAVRTGIV